MSNLTLWFLKQTILEETKGVAGCFSERNSGTVCSWEKIPAGKKVEQISKMKLNFSKKATKIWRNLLQFYFGSRQIFVNMNFEMQQNGPWPHWPPGSCISDMDLRSNVNLCIISWARWFPHKFDAFFLLFIAFPHSTESVIFFISFVTTLWTCTQRYTYRVLQTIQMKLKLLCVWAERAVLGSAKTALQFIYEIWIG